MMKKENTLLLLVFLLQIVLKPETTFSQTSSIITVNYNIDRGASNQVASGLLHGISADYPAQYLIDGIRIHSVRGADYSYGTNLPEYFNSVTYNRTKATGAKLMIGLYYYKTNNSYWPGDNGDWGTWRNICKRIYNEAQSKGLDVYSWITWNEPRAQWKNLNSYMEAHKVAYDAIKACNSKALVQAPEDHSYDFKFLSRFLTFCKKNNCLPDILAWHELSKNPIDIKKHCSQISIWMQNNGITPIPIAITEYQGSSYSDDNTSIPGVNVYYLAEMERSVKYGLTFGLHACWSWKGNDPKFVATLADMANKDGVNLPRGLWWNYNAYKDMTGRLVDVSVEGLNSDAFASTDSDMLKSIILIGTKNYQTPHKITLNLKNIPGYLLFRGKIHIRVEMVPDSNIVMSPEIKVASDYTVSNGSLSLGLPAMDPKSSYIVYISPATVDAPKRSYEAESLDIPAIYSLGKTYRIFDEYDASGGKAVVLESTNNGEYIEFRIPSPGPGVYNLSAKMKRHNNRGFIQLYINGQSVCPPEDEYGEEKSQYYENDFGNIPVGTDDLFLRFVVVSKNPKSTNRWMVFDRFDLSRLKGITTHIEPKKLSYKINGGVYKIIYNPAVQKFISCNSSLITNYRKRKIYNGEMNDFSVFNLSGKLMKTVYVQNNIQYIKLISASDGMYIIKTGKEP